MGKIVLMQHTVDYVYKVDPNAATRFQIYGTPEVKELNDKVKYYRYE